MKHKNMKTKSCLYLMLVICQYLVTQSHCSCPCQIRGSSLECSQWRNLEKSREKIECPELVSESSNITSIYVYGDQTITNLNLDEAGNLLKINIDLSKITSLRVTNTSASSLQFSSLSHLEHLDVRDNKLTSLSPTSSENIKSLHLSGNSWTCLRPEKLTSWSLTRWVRVLHQRANIKFFIDLIICSK